MTSFDLSLRKLNFFAARSLSRSSTRILFSHFHVRSRYNSSSSFHEVGLFLVPFHSQARIFSMTNLLLQRVPSSTGRHVRGPAVKVPPFPLVSPSNRRWVIAFGERLLLSFILYLTSELLSKSNYGGNGRYFRFLSLASSSRMFGGKIFSAGRGPHFHYRFAFSVVERDQPPFPVSVSNQSMFLRSFFLWVLLKGKNFF